MTEQDSTRTTHDKAIELAESILIHQDPFDIDPEAVRKQVKQEYPEADAHTVEKYVEDRMWYRRGVQ